MRFALLITLSVLCCGGCCSKPLTATAPPRPGNVPLDAQWAGGVDGGAWIRCERVPKRSSPQVFECTTYEDSANGGIWSRGAYLLGTGVGEGFRPALRDDDQLPYAAYTGLSIELAPQRFFLVPHGEIDFPFGDGSGKRAIFDRGKQVGTAVSY